MPMPTEPKPTEPEPTESAPANPQPTQPKPTEPKPTEPKPTEPAPTTPQPSQPKPTEPKPTEHVHNYSVLSSRAATCTVSGSVVYRCSGCGDQYEEYIPLQEHSGEWVIEKPYRSPYWGAVNGVATRTCTVCGGVDSETLVFEEYYQPLNRKAQYSYTLYFVDDLGTSLYTKTSKTIFIQTDNPDPIRSGFGPTMIKSLPAARNLTMWNTWVTSPPDAICSG